MAKSRIIKKIAEKMPGLDAKLAQAGMPDTVERFLKKTMLTAVYMSLGVCIFLFFLFAKIESGPGFLIAVFPILTIMMFFYFLKLPDVRVMKIEKDIDNEIVYAGRFIVIELESGIPIYEAFRQVKDNYPVIGRYFDNIIHDIDLGTPMEEALNKSIDMAPSQKLRRILWQILNSMTTGSDIAKSLSSVIEQVVREQKVELNEYGRKLNPLSMFYMIVAVVLPSIGITMFVVFVSFLSIQLTLTTLLIFAALMGFIQFLFYSIVKSSRPASQFD